MYRLSTTLLILALSCLISCKKKDEQSSGTVKEPSDYFAGTWKMTDTTSYTNPQTQSTETRYDTATGSIFKVGPDSLRFEQFPRYNCNSMAGVIDGNKMDINVYGPCLGPFNFHATLSGDTMYYTYAAQGLVVLYIRGRAIRQ